MTNPPIGERDGRLLREIERLRQGGGPSVDSPEAHVQWLDAGLAGLATLVRETAPIAPISGPISAEQFRAFAVAMLGEVEKAGGDMLTALHVAAAAGVAAANAPVQNGRSDREAVARIVDDEIWDGDGDYPLDRRRIADRREKAYAKADAILALMRGE